ncbi:MAG: hypothetical protein ACOCRB_02635 [Halanaerobiaceae bacterium]
MDHIVSILAANSGGYIWTNWGSQWVFFLAAVLSLGNLYVAYKIQPEKEKELAEKMQAKMQNSGM